MDAVIPPNVEGLLQMLLLAALRPGAALLAAPVFGSANIPVQLRMLLAVAVGLPMTGSGLIAIPAEGLISWHGLFLMAGEIVLGLAIGFALQMALGAALIAGETISNTMGLGFAMMVDPMSGRMNTAVGQFLALLATALFLAADGHLVLMTTIADSYQAFPVGDAFPRQNAVAAIINFGSAMFTAGLAIALPVGFALVLVQLVMAVIGRSAPALNLFSVGLPATLLFGTILMALALPSMADALALVIGETLGLARSVAGS
jgi:flagellar biosynthesis protein FliR